MRKIQTGFNLLDIDFIKFELRPEVTSWLAIHNISNYLLTSNSIYDKLGPFIEFGDDVPDELINWFILRWGNER